MKIKITEKNADEIESELAKVNGRASKHTYATFEQLLALTDRAETQLEASNLPKNRRVGARLIASGAGPSANSYGYSVNTTKVRIDRCVTGWFLVGVEQANSWPKHPEFFALEIDRAQAEEIARRAVRHYLVRGDK